MKSLRKVEYPAICKAQRMTAERLGVLDRDSECVNPTDVAAAEQRPFGSLQFGPTRPTAIHMQVDEESVWPSSQARWVWDTGTAGPTARGEPNRAKMPASRCRSPTADDQPRRRDGDSGNGRSAHRKCSRERSDRRPGEGGSLASPRSVSRSASESPPPQLPPPRLGEERARSLERTVRDIGQISRSVREEATNLGRFLHHEATPAVQKVFEEAVAQHSKACRLLDVNHLQGMAVLGNHRQGRGSRPVASDNSIDLSTSTASPGTATGLNASAASTHAWQKAVRAGVIEVTPPPGPGVRASMPARTRILRATRGGGGVGGNDRFSLYIRPVVQRQKELGGMRLVAASEEVEEEEAGGLRSKGAVADGGDSDSAAAVGGKADGRYYVEVGQDESDADEDDEDDDEGWGDMLPTDISAKIVGLSTLIRRKAAEASQGRRNQQ